MRIEKVSPSSSASLVEFKNIFSLAEKIQISDSLLIHALKSGGEQTFV
jgi:hypothetical protein